MSLLSRISSTLLLLCIPALAADWATWLGPKRDGKSSETGLLASWPEGGPKAVWRATALGEGYSSMAVVGNRIYTQGQQGEQQFVLALDAATGKQVWKTPNGKAFANDQGVDRAACLRWRATGSTRVREQDTLIAYDIKR